MRAAPEASATTSTTTKDGRRPAPLWVLAIVVGLLFSSLPVVAGELPAVERGWQKNSSRFREAFLDDTMVRFADADQVVELVRTRGMADDWLPDRQGRMELKRTWIGDLWVDGKLVGRDRVVSTSFGPYTWTTIHGPHGSTTLFPDGRSEYAESGNVSCGTSAPYVDRGASALSTDLPDAAKPATVPPANVEILDAVFYTVRAERYWGLGTAQARLLNVQDDHNLNLANSGLGHIKIRFVGFHRDTSYRDSATADPSNGLGYFSEKTKRYKTIRKQDHADLMTLFAYDMPFDKPFHYSGIAQVLGPYKLVGVFGYRYSDTYTHEVGHNLGLSHALAYANCPHNPPGDIDGIFVTVMYSSGQPSAPPPPIPTDCEPSLITLYSNKNWMYLSPWTGTTFPLGDAGHHEAAILITNAPKVAKWMK